MTAKSLMRSVAGSPELIVAGMRDRVLTRLDGFGEFELRVLDEPVFRLDETGRLRQSVRLEMGDPTGVTCARLLDGDQEVAAVRDLAGLPKTVRLFVPEVTTPQRFAVELEIAGDRRRGTVTVHPQRKWTVHLVHHSHLDIGYTDPQGMVLSHHLEFLDAVLDLAAATDDWADDARFRWNVEAVWPFAQWLRQRPTSQVDRMVELVRSGRVEVTAMPFNLHTEAASSDELHEQLRLATELRTRHGFDVVSAMQTDVPGATVGFVDALTDAGVRYLAAAHNWAGRSVPHLVGGVQLPRLFRWRAPSGRSVAVWLTDSPHGMAYMEGNLLGLADQFSAAADLLPAYLSSLATQPYPYGPEMFGLGHLDLATLNREPYPHDLLHLRVQGRFGDNASPSLEIARIVREWNETFAYPQLRVSTNHAFFLDAEQRYGSELPTFTGDWTDWWADGIGSGARPLGYARRAQAALPIAATLHTLADLRGASSSEDVAGTTRQVYENLALFDEHTWGAGNPWGDAEEEFDSGAVQWQRKSDFAHRAFDDAHELLEGGVRRLAATVPARAGALASVVVWNPASRTRDDVVRVFLPASRVPLDVGIAVTDPSTGRVIPHDEQPQQHPIHRPIGRFLLFTATAVPGLGYRRYDLHRGCGPAPITTLDAPVIENDFYRLTYHCADARIESLFDKLAGRELVNAESPVGFNQYIHDRYTSAPAFNHLSSRVFADGDLPWLGARATGRHATVLEAVRTAVDERLTVQLVADGTEWIRTTISLPAGIARADITNRIAKIGTTAKESGFFSFPINLDSAEPEFGVTGGIAGPGQPSVPGSARHMRAIRHWAALQDAELAVGWATLEAPLVQFGDLYLPYAPFPGTLPQQGPEPATLHSWVFNNVWDTNFPASQSGEMTFRYAISSSAGGNARGVAIRTAAALTQPLHGFLAGGAPHDDAPIQRQLVQIDRDDVTVLGLARTPGGALAIKLQSFADQPARVTLRLPGMPIHRAYEATLLGEPRREISVEGDAVSITLPRLGVGCAVLHTPEHFFS